MNEKPQFILRFSPLGEMIWRSVADEIFIGSSRGAAKTFYLLLLFLHRLVYWPGYRCVFFREHYSDIERLTFPEIEKAIKILGTDGLRLSFIKSTTPKVENKKNGSSMIIAAAESEEDAESFQGGNVHGVGVDESQTINPRVLEKIPAIVRATVGDWTPQIYWLANANGKGQAWLKNRFLVDAREKHGLHGNVKHKELFVHPITGESFIIDNHWRFGVREEKTGIVKTREVMLAKTWMNPALDYREYEATLRLSLKDNETLTRQWVENDWDAMAGQFFPNLSHGVVEHCERYQYDRVLCSIDHGYRKTAVVWTAVDSDGLRKVFDCEVYLDEEILDTKDDEGNVIVRGKASKILDRHKNVMLYIIDPAARQKVDASTGARTVISIYAEAGLYCVPCKTNNRPFGWEAIRNSIADGTIQISKRTCKLLIDSLAGLMAKTNDSEDCEKDHGVNGQKDGDHLADAFRYLIVNGFYTGEEEPDEFMKKIRKSLEDDPEFREAIEETNERYIGYR